jgi:hypothetical protein
MTDRVVLGFGTVVLEPRRLRRAGAARETWLRRRQIEHAARAAYAGGFNAIRPKPSILEANGMMANYRSRLRTRDPIKLLAWGNWVASGLAAEFARE